MSRARDILPHLRHKGRPFVGRALAACGCGECLVAAIFNALDGFAGAAERLGAQLLPLGGQVRLAPLELGRQPDHLGFGGRGWVWVWVWVRVWFWVWVWAWVWVWVWAWVWVRVRVWVWVWVWAWAWAWAWA